MRSEYLLFSVNYIAVLISIDNRGKPQGFRITKLLRQCLYMITRFNRLIWVRLEEYTKRNTQTIYQIINWRKTLQHFFLVEALIQEHMKHPEHNDLVVNRLAYLVLPLVFIH